MTTEELTIEHEGGIAVVILDRPERRNALTATLMSKLWAVMGDLDAASGVNAVILTGRDPAFCAGLDLQELSSSAENLHMTTEEHPWPTMSKVVIGAVNGVAVTGGLELALNCDFIVASERAAFADTHSRVGLLPGWGLSVLLPQAVGLRRAKEMSVTGNYLSAEMACAWGLANRVVPHSDLLRVSMKLAQDIESNDLKTLSALLALYDDNAAGTLAEGLHREWRISRAWRDATFSPEGVAERKGSIQQRGRRQVR